MAGRQLWDIFCTVIDNHGDLGVCWRLSRQLAEAGHAVRLWVDDASALTWMAPEAVRAQWPHLQVLPWDAASDTLLLARLAPAEVWIEAFGCTLPPAFVAHGAQSRAQPPVWINLEYLSAEDWVPRQHGLPSPVMSGPAKGWTKYFFYPGFSPETGGLLREKQLAQRQATFDRSAWRKQHAPDLTAEGRLISLFCYEPVALPQLLQQMLPPLQHPLQHLLQHPLLGPEVATPQHLLVTPSRPLAAVKNALLAMAQAPNWSALPYTDQEGFDEMLWACDLNFVRGEDSLVRAIWAGQPFIWHIYPQDDNAHHAKLDAFLDALKAPASLRAAHHSWNGIGTVPWPALDDAMLAEWAACTQAARKVWWAHDDLQCQLSRFVSLKAPPKVPPHNPP